MASQPKRRARIRSRRASDREHEFAILLGLIDMFRSRSNPWQVGASGFEARVPLLADTLGGTVVYKIHTVGWGDRRMRFHASVTFWPRRISQARRAKGETPAQQEKRWEASCTRLLRRSGYKGRWSRTPWGRMGDYWKHLSGMKALRAEVALHDRWSGEPPW
jgi:hypothetical protein